MKICSDQARAFTLFIALALLRADIAEGADFIGRVVNVHDGDTLSVLVDYQKVRVRLVQIDAPELGQAFGRRSKESLASICATQTAFVNGTGKDRYGRQLGWVTCNGIEANSEQVRRGMAWAFVRYAPKDSPLHRLQAQAKLEQRGLWAEASATPPWEWRAQQRGQRSTRF